MLLDGEVVDSAATSGTLNTGDAAAVLGALAASGQYGFDGRLAMPVILDGSFTRRQVDRFCQWRRMIHGIY